MIIPCVINKTSAFVHTLRAELAEDSEESPLGTANLLETREDKLLPAYEHV